MAKYRIYKKDNLITIDQKQFTKINVNERELKVFEANLLRGMFQPKMLKPNRIVYTAPLSVSLDNYVKKNLTGYKLYSIVAQCREIFKSVDMYNLYPHNLILDKKLIYVRENSGELFFLYTPIKNDPCSVNVYGFLADMIAAIEPENDEIIETRGKLLSFLIDRHQSLDEIEFYIKQQCPEVYKNISRKDNGKSGFISSTQLGYMEHYNVSSGFTSAGLGKMDDDIPTTLLQEDEGTTLLHNDEDTVLLAQQREYLRLKRRKTGEVFEVKGNEYKIGKNFDMDCCIDNNKTISRHHATIVYKNLEYYIRDEKSTNKTYLNNNMIIASYEEELRDGDVIRLSDEEFDICIE